MKETKPNILSAALKLFNEEGFVNVRLQHIADEANVSIGNMAYHFATKKDILYKIYEALVQRQVELLNELSIVPIFEHMDRRWDNVFALQKDYAFFYQDTLEILRFDPNITARYRKHIQWEKEQFRRLLDFNISRGALKAFNNYDTLCKNAELLWITENTWLQQSIISGRESPDVELFKQYMWQGIVPHLSPIGEQEYDQLIKNKSIPL